MTSATIGLILAAVLGSGGGATILNGWLASRREHRSQWTTWNDVWVENLEVLKAELTELRERVNTLEDELHAERLETMRLRRIMLQHNIDH